MYSTVPIAAAANSSGAAARRQQPLTNGAISFRTANAAREPGTIRVNSNEADHQSTSARSHPSSSPSPYSVASTPQFASETQWQWQGSGQGSIQPDSFHTPAASQINRYNSVQKPIRNLSPASSSNINALATYSAPSFEAVTVPSQNGPSTLVSIYDRSTDGATPISTTSGASINRATNLIGDHTGYNTTSSSASGKIATHTKSPRMPKGGHSSRKAKPSSRKKKHLHHHHHSHRTSAPNGEYSSSSDSWYTSGSGSSSEEDVYQKQPLPKQSNLATPSKFASNNPSTIALSPPTAQNSNATRTVVLTDQEMEPIREYLFGDSSTATVTSPTYAERRRSMDERAELNEWDRRREIEKDMRRHMRDNTQLVGSDSKHSRYDVSDFTPFPPVVPSPDTTTPIGRKLHQREPTTIITTNQDVLPPRSLTYPEKVTPTDNVLLEDWTDFIDQHRFYTQKHFPRWEKEVHSLRQQTYCLWVCILLLVLLIIVLAIILILHLHYRYWTPPTFSMDNQIDLIALAQFLKNENYLSNNLTDSYGEVTSPQIADGAITIDKIAPGVLGHGLVLFAGAAGQQKPKPTISNVHEEHTMESVEIDQSEYPLYGSHHRSLAAVDGDAITPSHRTLADSSDRIGVNTDEVYITINWRGEVALKNKSLDASAMTDNSIKTNLLHDSLFDGGLERSENGSTIQLAFDDRFFTFVPEYVSSNGNNSQNSSDNNSAPVDAPIRSVWSLRNRSVDSSLIGMGVINMEHLSSELVKDLTKASTIPPNYQFYSYSLSSNLTYNSSQFYVDHSGTQLNLASECITSDKLSADIINRFVNLENQEKSLQTQLSAALKLIANVSASHPASCADDDDDDLASGGGAVVHGSTTVVSNPNGGSTTVIAPSTNVQGTSAISNGTSLPSTGNVANIGGSLLLSAGAPTTTNPFANNSADGSTYVTSPGELTLSGFSKNTSSGSYEPVSVITIVTPDSASTPSASHGSNSTNSTTSSSSSTSSDVTKPSVLIDAGLMNMTTSNVNISATDSFNVSSSSVVKLQSNGSMILLSGDNGSMVLNSASNPTSVTGGSITVNATSGNFSVDAHSGFSISSPSTGEIDANNLTIASTDTAKVVTNQLQLHAIPTNGSNATSPTTPATISIVASGDNATVSIQSDSNIQLTSDGAASISSGAPLSLQSNASVSLVSNEGTTISSRAGDVSITAANAVHINATGADGASITSQGPIVIVSSSHSGNHSGNSSSNNSVGLVLQSADSMHLISSTNVTVTSGNDFNLLAQDSIHIAAQDLLTHEAAGILIHANSNQGLNMSSSGPFEAVSAGSMALTSNGSFSLASSSTVELYSQQPTSIRSDTSVGVTASDSLNLSSGAPMTMTSQSSIAMKSSGPLSVSSDSNAWIITNASTTVTTGADLLLQSHAVTAVSSGTSLTLQSGTSLLLQSNASTTMSVGANLLVQSSNSTTVSAGTNILIQSNQTTTVAADLLSLNSVHNASVNVGSTLAVSAGNSVLINAGDSLQSSGSNITASAKDTNIVQGGNQVVLSSKQIAIRSGQAVTVHAGSAVNFDTPLITKDGYETVVESTAIVTNTSSTASNPYIMNDPINHAHQITLTSNHGLNVSFDSPSLAPLGSNSTFLTPFTPRVRISGTSGGPLFLSVLNCNAANNGRKMTLVNVMTHANDVLLLVPSVCTANGGSWIRQGPGGSVDITCNGVGTDAAQTPLVYCSATGHAAETSSDPTYTPPPSPVINRVARGTVRRFGTGYVELHATYGRVNLTLIDAFPAMTNPPTSFVMVNSEIQADCLGLQWTLVQTGAPASTAAIIVTYQRVTAGSVYVELVNTGTFLDSGSGDIVLLFNVLK